MPRAVIRVLAKLSLCIAASAAASLPAAAQPASDPDAQHKADLIVAYKILVNEGILDSFGHVSVRSSKDPGVFFMPRAMPPALVSAADIVELDLDCKPVNPEAPRTNGERFIHGEIYKARPDAECILHYHADELVALAATGQEIKVIANCGVAFHRGTPIYDSPVLIRNPELGDKVAATLGDKRAVLLRGHGGTVAADNLDQLVLLILVERLESLIIQTQILQQL